MYIQMKDCGRSLIQSHRDKKISVEMRSGPSRSFGIKHGFGSGRERKDIYETHLLPECNQGTKRSNEDTPRFLSTFAPPPRIYKRKKSA